jgi:hypothetical protein
MAPGPELRRKFRLRWQFCPGLKHARFDILFQLVTHQPPFFFHHQTAHSFE